MEPLAVPAHAPGVQRDPALALVLTQEERMLRDAVYGVTAGFGHAYYTERTQAGEPPTALWDALAQKGYLGVNIPEEYGGGGLGMYELAAVIEETGAAGSPLLMLVVSPAIVGSILARHGSPDQRERWLRGIAAGTMRIAFAITEPDAGSNSHNIATTARRDGDRFILKGAKTFISGVDDAQALLVVARTGTQNGRGQLSLFIVDTDTPGLERQHVPTAVQAPEKQWMLFFDDVVVDADRLIGPEHGGLKAVFDGLNPERIAAAAIATGLARYALDKATRYANERAVWGKPIGTHQGVSHPLAQAKIELELARLMTRQAAALYDAGADAAEASNMAKYASAEAAIRCVDQAIQTLGGNGLALEYGLSDVYWMARLMRTGPVSREMVLNYVAEHTLGLPRSY